MKRKGANAISEADRVLIKDNSQYIREAIFSCVTEAQVECAVSFARYLSRAGLNAENFELFLRLIRTNNPWVIDELIGKREPRLLFSPILPHYEIIEAAFQTLFFLHPEECYRKALEALLGIVESAYHDADDGFRIRRLSIMDINALGKFLDKDEPQEDPSNALILQILDRITRLGEYGREPDKNVIAKHAFRVRFAYFDHTMELVDAIPHPLLVRIPDHEGSVPDEDYAALFVQRRSRRASEGAVARPFSEVFGEAKDRARREAVPSGAIARKSDAVARKSDAVARKSGAVARKSDAVERKSDAVARKSDAASDEPAPPEGQRQRSPRGALDAGEKREKGGFKAQSPWKPPEGRASSKPAKPRKPGGGEPGKA